MNNPLQLLDLPGIIEGAKDGKGRGRQVCLAVIEKSHNKSTGDCCSAHLLVDSYGARRTKTSASQEAARTRARGLWHSIEQETAANHVQEEGQGMFDSDFSLKKSLIIGRS